MKDTILKPKEIVEKLDNFIISQDNAKKAVAIALRNRWRRSNASPEIRDEIMPNNIIMIGPTGVGKTEIARRLATLAQSPFIKVEATKFTEVGYVGRDVESIIRDLVEMAFKLVEDEFIQEFKDHAKEETERFILDLILPESVEDCLTDKEKKSFDKARKKLLEQYRSGDLDDRIISIEVPENNMGGFTKIFPMGGDSELGDLAEELGSALGGKLDKKTKKEVCIGEAKEIILQQEIEEKLDKNKIKEEALRRAENDGIVFIDEIDKIAAPSKGNGPDVSRQGVQRDLLPIVEGSTVKTKHGFVKTDHMLFIASGAFHESKPSDLVPEMQGRFPIRVELDNLTTDDFVKILVVTKNAPIKQYQALLETENINLIFKDDAINAIAEKATEINDKIENIGARRLHTIMTKVLENIMFDAPDVRKKIVITRKDVENALDSITKIDDMSRYIL